MLLSLTCTFLDLVSVVITIVLSIGYGWLWLHIHFKIGESILEVMEEDIICKTTSKYVASYNYNCEFNFLVGNDFGMIYFFI